MRKESENYFFASSCSAKSDNQFIERHMFIDRKAFGLHRLCQLWQLAMTSAECTISILSSFVYAQLTIMAFLFYLSYSLSTYILLTINIHFCTKSSICHRIRSDSSANHFRFFHLLIALLNFMFFSESFRRFYFIAVVI